MIAYKLDGMLGAPGELTRDEAIRETPGSKFIWPGKGVVCHFWVFVGFEVIDESGEWLPLTAHIETKRGFNVLPPGETHMLFDEAGPTDHQIAGESDEGIPLLGFRLQVDEFPEPGEYFLCVRTGLFPSAEDYRWPLHAVAPESTESPLDDSGRDRQA